MPVQTTHTTKPPVIVKEKSSTMGYKAAIVVLVLIIIGLLVFNPTAFGDKAKAEKNVKDLYKIITGGEVDIVKTEDQNGIYKVSVRYKTTAGTDSVSDIFVTKDGLFITDKLLDINTQKSSLTNQSSFANCLASKQVAIVGLSTDQATQVQLQALGAFSSRIYVDCSGQNLAICQQLNITQIPMVFYNGTLMPGPLSLSWFEQNLNCYMTANGTKEA